MLKHIFSISIFAAAALHAADIYVDYNNGSGKNPGTKDAPLRYIYQAAKKAQPGDTVYILPSPAPIKDNFKITNINGTPDKPIIFDGMNNIFTGAEPLKDSEWKEIKPGYFSKKIVTGKNWSHRFYMIFNGKINRMGRIQKSPGAARYKKVDELAPGEWTVLFGAEVPSNNIHHKQFETEYVVRLPQGATSLKDSGVEVPNVRKPSGVQIYGKNKYVIFRNLFVKNFYNDGYNIHGDSQNIGFENVAAVDCGDDAISAHSACSINVKNLVAIGCSTAICHINKTVCTHENVYAEKIIGRELFLLHDSRNVLKNVYMFADSYSGSCWESRKKTEHQIGNLENIYIISRNPKAKFNISSRGVVELKAANVKIAGFADVMKLDGVTAVDKNEILEKISAAKKELFALFGGNLEKAL